MKKIAVFCSGYGSNLEALAVAARRGRLGAQIALVVCDNPKAYALRRAKKHGIPAVLISPKLFDSRQTYERLILRILKLEKVDAVVLAGFMRIFTPVFIRGYKNRILNIHPSLLPRFKGAHAIRDAFDAEVRWTGVTVHIVTQDVDAGPILAQKKVLVSARDTLASLEKKIHKAEHALYPVAVRRFLKSSKS